MLKSFKDCNCFSRMISSIMSMTNQTNQEKVQSKKRPRKLQKSNKNVLNSSVNPNVNPQLQKQIEKIASQVSKFQSKTKKQIKKDKTKKEQINQQAQQQNLNEGVPQTERTLVNQEKSLSDPSESNENDLPTEKSEIIMNDIGKGVNHNQNIFMNQSKQESQQKFENIYERLRLVRSLGIYDEYEVKRKDSNQIFKAYVIKYFGFFLKTWDLQEKDAIESYCQFYEVEKIHIQNLIQLQKLNCRHMLKLMDYEFRPPTIDMVNDRKFCQGSIVLVFENVKQTLQEFLESNKLDKLDKKRIIYQLVTCMKDVHQNKMVPKNISLKNFYIDQFQNIKFISFQVQQHGRKSKNSFYQSKGQQNLPYLPPQKLVGINETKNTQNLRNSYFHSGFSVISDFDKNQSSQEQQNLWRLGTLIAKILTGNFIFNQASHQLHNKQIVQALKCQSQEQPRKYSNVLSQKLQGLSQRQIGIILSLLKIEPNQRKPFKQLLESDYLKNLLEEQSQ